MECPVCGKDNPRRWGHQRETCSKVCGRIRQMALLPQKRQDALEVWFDRQDVLTEASHIKLRLFMIKKLGEQCEHCGWKDRNPTNDKCYLHMDHIDGDATNNRRNNLRIICPNCHTLTPTYCGLNKGRGRKSRKKVIAG